MAMTLDQQRAEAEADAARRAAEAAGQGTRAPATNSGSPPPAISQPAPKPVPQAPAPAAPSQQSTLGRYGDIVGEGIARGAVSLPGVPASMDTFLSDQARKHLPGWLSSRIASPEGQGLHSVLPDVGDMQSWLDRQEQKYGVAIKPPQTSGEKLASAAAQGVGGALAGGAGEVGAVRSAFSGASGGAVGEALHQLFPKSDWAPIIGNLIGGGAPLLAKPGSIAAATAKPAEWAEKTFSPTTVDASSRAAESIIRGSLGTAARDTAQTAEKLIPFRAKTMALAPAERDNFVHYMETRSTANAPRIPAELQPAADAVRDAYQLRETKLSNMPSTARMNFITDYYMHQWKDPKKAQQFVANFVGAGKEGSGKNLKERSLPTIADGLKAGLEPLEADPIQNTLNYVANMDRFIATKQIFDTGKAQGLIKVLPAGSNQGAYLAGQGWKELNTFAGKGGPTQSAWAQEGFANVYNNMVSKGFHGNEQAGQAYDVLQKVNGAINASQLGISAFHLATMAQEAVVNDVARGLSEAFDSPMSAVKTIAKAPAAAIGKAMRGNNVLKEYLHPGTSRDPLMKQIVKLGEQANMNIATITKDLRASNAGSYWDAWKRGTLRMELAADARTAKGAPITGSAKMFFKNFGRTLDTFAQPLFEKYIPRLKAGAFYDNMKSWLEANPNASAEEQAAQARQMWDSIDNRFGEMNHDNLFWNQTLKQSARLAMRSYSWTLGTMREIGGGAADLARHPTSISRASPHFSPRAAYPIALAMTYGALAAAYQYMKTGQAPQDFHDLVAPRTGGTDASTHKPERIEFPSYMKDVFGWVEQGPVKEIENKASPLVQTGQEMITGKDWRGLPIADPNGTVPQWLSQWMQHIGSSYIPISAQQLAQGKKKGSNLSLPERMLNLRGTPAGMTDPEGTARKAAHFGSLDWRRKQKSDKRMQNQYGGIE